MNKINKYFLPRSADLRKIYPPFFRQKTMFHLGTTATVYEHRGALRGTPGSAYAHPELNATELPSSAPGRPELIELQASTPSPTPTRAEEYIATTPDCGPRAPAPSPTPTRAGHLAGLQILRLRALARRRAPKRTPHVAGLQTLPRFAPLPIIRAQRLALITAPRAESLSAFGAARLRRREPSHFQSLYKV